MMGIDKWKTGQHTCTLKCSFTQTEKKQTAWTCLGCASELTRCS